MDDKLIEEIITNYEDKLKKRGENFQLTPFEKTLMRQCLVYGYEYCKNESKNK